MHNFIFYFTSFCLTFQPDFFRGFPQLLQICVYLLRTTSRAYTKHDDDHIGIKQYIIIEDIVPSFDDDQSIGSTILF